MRDPDGGVILNSENDGTKTKHVCNKTGTASKKMSSAKTVMQKMHCKKNSKQKNILQNKKPNGNTKKCNRSVSKTSNSNNTTTASNAPGGKRIAANPPKELLKNDDVRRWYENMSRSSEINADVYLRRLNLFCYKLNTNPTELAAQGAENSKKAEDCLLDHVTLMERNGHAPQYIASVIKAVKSWLTYNHVDIKRRIRITNVGTCTTINNEKVPDQDQLHKILSAATPRGRAIISLIAFSGIRPQVMGLAKATDGLRIGDLPELVVKDKNVAFSEIPAMIVVRPNLSKTKNKYVTFLGAEGCEHLLGYLRYRISKGDILGPDAPIIAVDSRNRAKGWHNKEPDAPPFLTTPAITGSIRGTILSIMKIRPYALRSYFDTQLLLAESHGCMTHAYRQFFMGHKGDMEARYTTNKGRLTDQMREDMRRAYKQSQMFLSSEVSAADVDSKKKMLVEIWDQQARMYGLDPKNMIRTDDSVSNVTANVSPDATQPDGTSDNCLPADDPYESKIIKEESDLVRYCAQGWEVVSNMPGGRFLIRKSKTRQSRSVAGNVP